LGIQELQHAHAKYQEAEREHQEQKTNLERQKEIQHNEYIKIISQKQDEIDKLTKQIISEKENSSESNKGASKEVAKLHLQLSEKDRLINDMKMKHAEACVKSMWLWFFSVTANSA
jgi:Mg2+ and Co2+ transporter CorA